MDIRNVLCWIGGVDTKTGTDRYIYISSRKTWYEAQAYCRTYHTDLASARDTTENTAIEQLTSGYTWFGLFRDSWKWTDQTNFSTLSWMPGNLDNALSNEICGYLNNGQAAAAQCSDIMPFFCYSIITRKQQIMRVKIRSNQDVNNPEVNAAILEQIKEKLKYHGMANNIVQWKEQLDGKKTPAPLDNQVLCLSPATMRTAFPKINVRKAAGTNNIPGRVLKDCAEELSSSSTSL
ncbi:hypothetical protein QTP70_008928 [Hemibagrus guttatus]|uniref:C-type lectin domain-containing protein n=1 Tax=Hemibagrus guttatus TaxID=175788 RepID=A0AAE0QBJ8_9TELE|nr:hypothetical protein QTP70_008928 [Hemibagrus guttatus]